MKEVVSTTKLAVGGPITPLGSNERTGKDKNAAKFDFIDLDMVSSSVTRSPRSFPTKRGKRFGRQILPVQCPMKKLKTGSDQEKLANVLQSSKNSFYGRFKLRCLVFWLKQLVLG